MIRRIRVTADIEKDIVTMAIVSDRYCREVLKMWREEYFQFKYARLVMRWVEDYYTTYSKAPDNLERR